MHPINLKICPVSSFEHINDVHNRVPEFDQWDISRWKERCADGIFYAVIAWLDERAVGYMVSYDRYQDGSIYCWMTAVLPDYRNRGILKSMMDDLTIWAQENNYSSITIKTRNKRHEMRSFLANNGFHVLSVESQECVLDNRIFLQKKLT